MRQSIRFSITTLFFFLFAVSVWSQKRPITLESLEAKYTQNPTMASALAYAEALESAGSNIRSVPLWEYLAKANAKYYPRLWKAYSLSYEWDRLHRSLQDFFQKTTSDGALKSAAHLYDKHASQMQGMQERSLSVEVVDSVCLSLEEALEYVARRVPSVSLAKAHPLLADALASHSASDLLIPSLLYQTEQKERLLYVAYDDEGCPLLRESLVAEDRIVQTTEHSFGEDGLQEIAMPFLKTDGIHLVFSAVEKNTVGNRNLYIARKNEEGKYLKPTLLGMPFNSPANDYLLAYDEYCHVGFLVSDRFAPRDKVNVYTLVWEDNFAPLSVDSTQTREPLVMLYPYKSTQKSGKDYSSWRTSCREKKILLSQESTVNFEPLQITTERVYFSDSDFLSEEARLIYYQYIKLKGELLKREERLALLRKSYRNAEGERRQEMAEQILEEESALPEEYVLLKEWIKNIRRIEAELATD